MTDPYVGFDVQLQLFEVLNYRAVDTPSETGVFVSDDTSLVANILAYILVERATGRQVDKK